MSAFALAGRASATGSQTITGPTTATAGVQYTISGAGWTPYDSVTIYFVHGSSTNICTLHADSYGTVNPYSCPLPTYLSANSYTLHATDGTLTYDMPTPVVLGPSIGLLSTFRSGIALNVAAGSTLSLSGHGFTASSSISSVKVGTTTVATTPASITTDTNGTFGSTIFTVPASTALGQAIVTVTDASSHVATIGVNVFKPKIKVTAKGSANVQAVVSGTGWPSEDNVTFYIHNPVTNSNTNICSIRSSDTGVLSSYSCAVPTYVPAGSDTILATDSNVTVSAPFEVDASLALTSKFNGQILFAIQAGDSFTLAGHGYAASSTITSVKLGANALTISPAVPTTDTNGTFTGLTVTLPTTAKTGTLTVTDAAAHSATYKLTVWHAKLTVPTSVVSGNDLEFSGSAWPANDGLTIYVHNTVTGANTNLCSPHSDSAGNIVDQTCTIPTYVPFAADTILITDGQITVQSKAFSVDASLAVTNTSGQAMISGHVGDTVHIAGHGFTAGSTITKIKIGTKTIATVPGVPTTDTNGTFSGVVFSIPSIAAGTYTLTATDAANHTASVQFIVD